MKMPLQPTRVLGSLLGLLRSRQAIAFAAVGLLVVAIGSAEQTSAREGSAARGSASAKTRPGSQRRLSGSRQTAKNDVRRLREGTIITDQSGFFREDGEGATFMSDTGWTFGALPNLNLERVTRLLKSTEEPGNVRWSVSGEVTEYKGRNFLLISRAVYKAATPPPAPGRIAAP